MSEPVEDKGTKAIFRALDILDLLREYPGGMMLSDIANAVELPKSTTHRILQALVYRQMIQETPTIEGHYRLGLGIMSLSRAFLEGFDLVREARPFLRDLNKKTEETVHLGMLDPTMHWVVYLEKIDSPQSIRMVSRVGQVVPVHCTSLGKAILAFLPSRKIDQIFADYEFKKFTENTLLSVEQLMPKFEKIREQGYAMDLEENEPGVICVGAAVLNRHQKPLVSISVSAPATRMQAEHLEKIIKAVCTSAQAMSEKFMDIPSTEVI